jgi:alanine dehydrogenase
MKIGCVKEIKRHEYRVGLTPDCVRAYVAHGHQVVIQAGAGEGAGFADADYRAAGASLEADARAIFAGVDMVVKVKEPQPSEYGLFKKDQILFTYLHLAPDADQTHALLKAGIRAVAYETIKTADGVLPCLKPMSEIAGRLAIQEGAKYLEKPFGGRGVLLGGVPGVPRGKVAILGGGVVGLNAAKVALGLGAEVTILDLSPTRLAYLDDIFGGRATTLYSTDANVARVLAESDLVVGGVLIPGAQTPKLVRKEHLKTMKKASVIVDVAVDQGGCCETTHATTHDDPVYVVDGVVHYAVGNMPGAVALTSTLALTSTTLKYGLAIADQGLEGALKADKALLAGLNVYRGQCTYPDVARAHGLAYTAPETLL